ncbi:sigma-70 family RNA polymerase sigma factor [Singulisphaera sp. PoT]|uniref:sigma-70 family RNA polymerase sigma factor n=1 Tax=Singulisphaera sp. PoT TaxID=3411797 RepID=UPI003BF4BF8D
MRNRKDEAVRRQLHSLFNLGTIRELTDGQLIERFSTGHGEAAELAFAALVERHGAMVMRACRARLGDLHDAHDAFQATFLILVEKADRLWVQDSLGPWLHQVAVRTARCARKSAARRRRRERRMAQSESRPPGDALAHDVAPLLHEEIDRLPERYRIPIVLCDLEGHSCEQAARLMGRPVGTVKSWRSRGRERLRDSLIRRGLAPSMALGMLLSDDAARGAVSESLAAGMAAGTASATARTLVKGVLMTMIFGKIRVVAALVLTLGVVTGGLGVAAVGPDEKTDPPGMSGPHLEEGKVPSEKADPHGVATARREDGPFDEADPFGIALPRQDKDLAETANGAWELTLREALLLALRNTENILEIRPDPNKPSRPGYAIIRIEDRAHFQKFRGELMAYLRSVEQNYWSLMQQRSELAAIRRAIKLTESALAWANAEFNAGRVDNTNSGKAEVLLAQLRDIGSSRSSDLKGIESRLRNMIGLSLEDKRSIIPATRASVEPVKTTWERCLLAMQENQPDILLQKLRLQDLARAGDDANAHVRQKEETYAASVRQQTKRSLARFYRELAASYHLYRSKYAMRCEREAQLEAQRVGVEENRRDGFNFDVYLSEISRYVDSVATESNALTAYNVSIVSLEEMQGTLLDHQGITLVDEKKVNPTSTGDFLSQLRLRNAPEPVKPIVPAAFAGRPANQGAEQAGAKAKAEVKTEAKVVDHDGKTMTFRFTLGNGPKPLELRGSFTIAPARDQPAESPAP